MYIYIQREGGRERASEWASEWESQSVSQPVSELVYIYNINDTCLTYDVISCKLSPFQVKKNPLVTSPSTLDSPGPWVISLLVDFYVRFGGWTINITYTVFISCIYILYDIFIHMYPKIFQSLNDWSNIYIYIHVSHGDINDEPLFHIYIYHIYILYQDLTHDNPIISSVGHFLSPKKKGVAIDAGTRSAATRLSASWCCMGARQSFRCFRPEKKTKPKEVWDNSLWDL